MSDYFLTVLAGLAGSAHMVSATLLSLSRLVYEFHGKCMWYYFFFNNILFSFEPIKLHVTSCSLPVLYCICHCAIFPLTDLLGTKLVKRLLSSTCILLSHKSREVVRATLEFIKVTIGVLPASEIVPHVEDLVSRRPIIKGSSVYIYINGL